MKVIDRSRERLVVEDKPALIILLSYASIGAGLILIVADLYEHVNREGFFWFGLALLGLGIAAYLRFNEYTLATFDKTNGKLILHRKPPFRKVVAESHLLTEIQNIHIEKPEADPSSTSKYRLGVSMKNGDSVPLARKAGSPLEECEVVAKRIQVFLEEE